MKKIIQKVLVLLLLGSILTLSSFIAIDISNYRMDSQKSLDISNELNLDTSNGQSLVFGTTSGPINLDPHYSYDTHSNDVIDQVVETLYVYNISDLDYPIVPNLATAMPSITPDGLEMTINLRQGVTFHDGTDFNATTVKWSFDRLNYFMNYSGNKYLPAPFNIPLPLEVLPTQIGVLYQTADGRPIINETEVVSNYVVRFHLNKKKASFLPILTYTGSGILSPTSAKIQGKELDYLTFADGDVLIGTGPFIYQDYVTDIQVPFTGNPDYWQGAPQLINLIFSIIGDSNALNFAVLAGDIDLCDSPSPNFFDQFEADPNIELVEAGNTLTTTWITFNYPKIPLVMRRAMSWALNYSYVIDVVHKGIALRWPTYIPNGILYANYSLNYPTFNRATARNFLLTDPVYGPILAGAGITGASPDSAWTNFADTTPLETYNYTWNIGSDLRRDMGNRLAFDLRYIGVKLDVLGVSWIDLLDAIFNQRNKLDLYPLAWAPDYLDPENYINPIWSNTSLINGGNFYEPDVQALMNEGLVEIDPVKRERIYDEIQRLMVEEYLPAMTILTGKNYDVYQNYVKGWIPNPMARVWFYPVYIESDDLIPPNITIYSPTPNQIFRYDIPDFNITIDDDSPIISTWYTLDGGLTNYSFSELIGIISQTAWDDQESGPVAITFYARDDAGNEGSETVTVIKEQFLFIEIVDQSYTSDEFYIEFLIYNGINQVIDFATIEMWWDGVEVSSSVQNLGNGIYSVSLDPITVAPGEDPILLNMFVSVDGYYNKYFETYIAVDPEVIDKEVPEKKEPVISGYELLIIIGITCGVLLIFIWKIKKS